MKIFKPVVGYEGIYDISACGDIRSHIHKPPRKLKPGLGTSGYRYVQLTKDGKTLPKQIHRLVLEAWQGTPPEKMEVNHKNGIKTDNRLENLEWATRSENLKHRIYVLGIVPKGVRGANNYNAVLTESIVRKIRKLYAQGVRVPELAERLQIGRSCLWHVIKRRSWSHVY